MKNSLNNILSDIRKYENDVSQKSNNSISESYQIATYLRDLLGKLKEHITKYGFEDINQEINFFKNIKPVILGKLIYYNKLFRVETSCPVDKGKLYHAFFANELEVLKKEYEGHISNSDFYRYYRSGRTDKDHEYFMLGKINFHTGLNSFVFEIDSSFSTYYDYKIARIVASELLYTYLLLKIDSDGNTDISLQNSQSIKDVFWTDSKNALVELIYALYASGSISYGKIGIRKINLAFFILFITFKPIFYHNFSIIFINISKLSFFGASVIQERISIVL